MKITRMSALTLATVGVAVFGLSACSSNDSEMTPEPAMTDSSMMSSTPSPSMTGDTMMKDDSKMSGDAMTKSPKAGDDAMMSTTSP